MQGEKGTFQPYKGRVDEGLNAGTGEFTIDLDADQGIEIDGALLALFQDGTRVFDKHGRPLAPEAIAPDVHGYFEGRLVLSDADPDVLKTALIVLEMTPAGDDEVLRGEIATLNGAGLVLMTDAGDRCVVFEDDTEIFLIHPDDGNGIRSERGALENLEPGQSVDIYGEEEDDGCFEADTIVVDLTVDVVPPENRAPMANAGDDATVDAGTSVMLDGSASSDPDGDALTYAWALAAPDGSAAVLAGADSAMPSFTTDVIGEYVVELTVSDAEFSDSDSVTISAVDPAQNQAPDGEQLYVDNCDRCHVSFANAPNWTATTIQNAIDENTGGMGSISLTPEEIEAIASALAARP
jgi:hypothetical protein